MEEVFLRPKSSEERASRGAGGGAAESLESYAQVMKRTKTQLVFQQKAKALNVLKATSCGSGNDNDNSNSNSNKLGGERGARGGVEDSLDKVRHVPMEFRDAELALRTYIVRAKAREKMEKIMGKGAGVVENNNSSNSGNSGNSARVTKKMVFSMSPDKRGGERTKEKNDAKEKEKDDASVTRTHNYSFEVPDDHQLTPVVSSPKTPTRSFRVINTKHTTGDNTNNENYNNNDTNNDTNNDKQNQELANRAYFDAKEVDKEFISKSSRDDFFKRYKRINEFMGKSDAFIPPQAGKGNSNSPTSQARRTLSPTHSLNRSLLISSPANTSPNSLFTKTKQVELREKEKDRKVSHHTSTSTSTSTSPSTSTTLTPPTHIVDRRVPQLVHHLQPGAGTLSHQQDRGWGGNAGGC